MKIRKQLFGALLALFLCVATAVPAFAASDMPRFVDNAGLLTDFEQSELLDKLDEISRRQQVDVVVVTTDALNGKTPETYADDFYDNNSYGFGADCDGVRLLLPHILLRTNPRRRRWEVLKKTKHSERMNWYEYF